MDIEDEISSVIDEANLLGVEIDVSVELDYIWLSNIERNNNVPGTGACVLMNLIEVSEYCQIPIRGSIVESHEALMAYYASLGFVADDIETKNGKIEKIYIEYNP